jgi:hypothetical protein
MNIKYLSSYNLNPEFTTLTGSMKIADILQLRRIQQQMSWIDNKHTLVPSKQHIKHIQHTKPVCLRT